VTYLVDVADALIGTWLLIMIVGGMMVWNISVLWRLFYSKDPRNRAANFVVKSASVPQPEIESLINEWQKSRMRKRNEIEDPPFLFLNSIYRSPSLCGTKESGTTYAYRHSFVHSDSGTDQQYRRTAVQMEEIRPLSPESHTSPKRQMFSLRRSSDLHVAEHPTSITIDKPDDLDRMKLTNTGSASPEEDKHNSMGFFIGEPIPESPEAQVAQSQESSENNLNYTTSVDDYSGYSAAHMKRMSGRAIEPGATTVLASSPY